MLLSMKATLRGYYTYPTANFPKKWADMRPQEREALKHYFHEVKHPIYVFVRKCKVSNPIEVMKAISVGLMTAPKIRKHIAIDYAPKVSQRASLAPKKTVIKRVGRHPMFWPALATIIIIELGIIVGAYLDSKQVIQLTYADPITKIEAEVKKAVEPVKAEAKVLGVSTVDKNDVQGLIRKYFGKDADMALKIAKCESGMNPNSKNKTSTASGVFQIIKGTWIGNRQAMGLDTDLNLRFDAEENVKTAYKIFQDQSWRPWECRKFVK